MRLKRLAPNDNQDEQAPWTLPTRELQLGIVETIRMCQ
jgi:hypothetical protein